MILFDEDMVDDFVDEGFFDFLETFFCRSALIDQEPTQVFAPLPTQTPVRVLVEV